MGDADGPRQERGATVPPRARSSRRGEPIVIELAAAAPAKPPPGAACNGCGVCCASAPCPLGLMRFGRRRGPCPALEWWTTEERYRCGLLARPARYFAWLPRPLQALAAGWARRAIAAGRGCDSQAAVVDAE